jgi:hypothetical protein
MDQLNPEFRKTRVDESHVAGPVLTPDESRQGVMTGRMRWVLAISITLVVIAFVALYAIYV